MSIKRAFQRREDEVRELFSAGVLDTSQVVPSSDLWEMDDEQDQVVSLSSWLFVNRAILPTNVAQACVVHNTEECVESFGRIGIREARPP